MKKTYQQPQIRVNVYNTESPLLAGSESKEVVRVTDFEYGGGGSGNVRSGGNTIWDDEDDDSSWDSL